MGGYYSESKDGPLVKNTRSDPNGAVWNMGDIALSHDRCITWRTQSQGGTQLPDHLVDPYRNFLIQANVNNYNKKVLPPNKKASIADKPKEDGVLGLILNQSDERGRIVDSGHVFHKYRRQSSTSMNRRAYLTYNKTGTGTPTKTPVDRLFVYGAQIVLPGSLFQYSTGTGSSTVKLPNINADDNFNQTYFSQKAISELAPTKPGFNLGAFLGEIREGLPSMATVALLKSGSKIHKGLSKEYVNYSFGTAPLLSDLIKLIKILKSSTERMNQIEKDAGKGVRRRMSFPTVEQTATFSGIQLNTTNMKISSGTLDCVPVIKPGQSGYNLGRVLIDEGSTVVSQRISQKIWFSGSFTYFLNPYRNDFERYLELSKQLLSPGLTIEALWQLSPWSWLADWIFDLESTITSNSLIADDSLVMNYGYLMAHNTYASKVSCTLKTQVTAFNQNKLSGDQNVESTYILENKHRYRSNPYGFSATTNLDFSAQQWSILAALGLSR